MLEVSLMPLLNYHILRYCKIIVTIEDVNDNYPFFKTRQYEGSVWQNAVVGTSIMTVHTFDMDSEINSKVEYRFTEVNDNFDISEKGVISTKASLKPLVTIGGLNYRVVASNTEPMTVGEVNDERQETKIHIFVTDLQPPKFTQSVFRGSIAENSKSGMPTKLTTTNVHRIHNL